MKISMEPDGWTCPYCQQNVFWGDNHLCGSFNKVANQIDWNPTYPPYRSEGNLGTCFVCGAKLYSHAVHVCPGYNQNPWSPIKTTTDAASAIKADDAYERGKLNRLIELAIAAQAYLEQIKLGMNETAALLILQDKVSKLQSGDLA